MKIRRGAMKKISGGLFYKWLAITFFYIIAFRTLDYVFSVSTNISFFEYGFLAFVTMWCEQQDKIKKEGERYERTQQRNKTNSEPNE